MLPVLLRIGLNLDLRCDLVLLQATTSFLATTLALAFTPAVAHAESRSLVG
jgi:hypothetical protein